MESFVWTEAFEVLKKESSRGCILIGGALLDEQLAAAIAARVVSKSTGDRLTKRVGFVARVQLAYGTGLLSTDERDSLVSLNNIRNQAAHFDGEIGFTDFFHAKSVQAAMDSLKVKSPLLVAEFKRDVDKHRKARRLFEVFICEMCLRLVGRAGSCRRLKTQQPTAANLTDAIGGVVMDLVAGRTPRVVRRPS